MPDKHAQAKLGFVVFLAILILITAIVWGKNIRIGKSSYPVSVVFNNVTGLEKGARVLVNGVPKGKVAGYALADSGVVVKLALDKDVILYSDAFAYLEIPDLMAEKVVAVYPGSSHIPLPPDAVLQGIPNYSFSQIFSSFGEMKNELSQTLTSLQQTTRSLQNILDNPQFTGSLYQTAENLSNTTRQLDDFVKSNRQDADSALANILSVSKNAADIISANSGDIQAVIKDIRRFSNELHTITELASELNSLFAADSSAFAKIMQDKQLYDDLKHMMSNLDSLVTDVRKNGVKTKVKWF